MANSKQRQAALTIAAMRRRSLQRELIETVTSAQSLRFQAEQAGQAVLSAERKLAAAQGEGRDRKRLRALQQTADDAQERLAALERRQLGAELP